MGGSVNRKLAFVVGAAAGVCVLNGDGEASETISYTYDPLGRLVQTSSSGTVNSGVTMSTTYDHAGNRCNYRVAGSSGSAPPSQSACAAAPTPPPPPAPPPPPSAPPSNQPPTANADWLAVMEWQSGLINVVANDSDADGDLPLALISVSDPSGRASMGSSTQVSWSGAPAGTYQVQYTVQDARGATATGTVTVDVTASDPNPCWPNICEW